MRSKAQRITFQCIGFRRISVDLTGGDCIRETERPFRGIEETYIRYKGRGRVVVAIRDVATVLTAYMPMKYIQK